MKRKYLPCLISAALFLSGCAGLGLAPEQAAKAPLGSIQNPVIDSNLTLAEALRKPAPAEFKSRQVMLEVLYYSFDGEVHKGQLVIDQRLISDMREVFNVAFRTRFPIASVVPVSHDRFNENGEWNSDNQSMKSNNTSAFNYRKVTGGKGLSMHAYGFAIDINPVQNPYIKGNIVLPAGAAYDPAVPGTLTRNCALVKTFLRLGWTWGGDWESLKDYQHFEKVLSVEIYQF